MPYVHPPKPSKATAGMTVPVAEHVLKAMYSEVHYYSDDRWDYWRFRQFLHWLAKTTGQTVEWLMTTEFISSVYVETLFRKGTYEATVEMRRLLEKVRYQSSPRDRTFTYWDVYSRLMTGDLEGAKERLEVQLAWGKENKHEDPNLITLGIPVLFFGGNASQARAWTQRTMINTYGSRTYGKLEHLSRLRETLRRSGVTMQKVLLQIFSGSTEHRQCIRMSTAQENANRWRLVQAELQRAIPNLAPDALEPLYCSGDMLVTVDGVDYPIAVTIKANAEGLSYWKTSAVGEWRARVKEEVAVLIGRLGGVAPVRLTLTLTLREVSLLTAELADGSRHYALWWTSLYAEGAQGANPLDWANIERGALKEVLYDTLEDLIEERRIAEAVHLARQASDTPYLASLSMPEAFLTYAQTASAEERTTIYEELGKLFRKPQTSEELYHRGELEFALAHYGDALKFLNDSKYSPVSRARTQECIAKLQKPTFTETLGGRVDAFWTQVTEKNAEWQTAWRTATGKKSVRAAITALLADFWPDETDRMRSRRFTLERDDDGVWLLTLMNQSDMVEALWIDQFAKRLPKALVHEWTVIHDYVPAKSPKKLEEEPAETLSVHELLHRAQPFERLPKQVGSNQLFDDIGAGEWTLVGKRLWLRAWNEKYDYLDDWYRRGATLGFVQMTLKPESYKSKKAAHVKWSHALLAHLNSKCPEAFTLCASLYGRHWGSYLLLAFWDYERVMAEISAFIEHDETLEAVRYQYFNCRMPITMLKGIEWKDDNNQDNEELGPSYFDLATLPVAEIIYGFRYEPDRYR